MKQTFVDKVYPADVIDQAYMFYNTEVIPKPKPQLQENAEVRFITQYQNKHRRMESVLKRHWSRLQQDPPLKTTISMVPQFSYRKAPNIKGKVAPSKFK